MKSARVRHCIQQGKLPLDNFEPLPELGSETGACLPAMATTSSDFVLDEGLDDDEDVLAFHSQRQRTESGVYEPPAPVLAPAAAHAASPAPPTDAVIIDGMPLAASRADLDSFLSGAGEIASLQLRRLDVLRILRARVLFDSTDAAAAALKLDGAEFSPGFAVSVKPASEERWEAGCSDAGAKSLPDGTVSAKQPSQGSHWPLPDASSVTKSFWSAFGAARAAAEKLEEQAKRLGEGLEERLHVSEKVAETRAAIGRVDADLHVSERMGEVAAAGKATADDIDQTYAISQRVGRIVDDVGSAARTVAREVDENLRISEKAREVTNMALQHNGIGPTVRTVVDNLESGEAVPAETPKRKKNYQPSGVEQDKEEEFPGLPQSEPAT